MREHPGQRDEAWFKREIVPKRDAFTLAEIAKATGLSFAACSRIRAGAREALGRLARARRLVNACYAGIADGSGERY
jgi:hypothetical protein